MKINKIALSTLLGLSLTSPSSNAFACSGWLPEDVVCRISEVVTSKTTAVKNNVNDHISAKIEPITKKVLPVFTDLLSHKDKVWEFKDTITERVDDAIELLKAEKLTFDDFKDNKFVGFKVELISYINHLQEVQEILGEFTNKNFLPKIDPLSNLPLPSPQDLIDNIQRPILLYPMYKVSGSVLSSLNQELVNLKGHLLLALEVQNADINVMENIQANYLTALDSEQPLIYETEYDKCSVVYNNYENIGKASDALNRIGTASKIFLKGFEKIIAKINKKKEVELGIHGYLAIKLTPEPTKVVKVITTSLNVISDVAPNVANKLSDKITSCSVAQVNHKLISEQELLLTKQTKLLNDQQELLTMLTNLCRNQGSGNGDRCD